MRAPPADSGETLLASDVPPSSVTKLDLRQARKRLVATGALLKQKWRIGRTVGSGGMGEVFEASHVGTGDRVAIKVLHASEVTDAELVERFRAEAYVSNRIDHEGAVRVRDIDFLEDGSPFMVMDLLQGESLATRLGNRGPLPPDEVVALVASTLDVLAAAHAKGIVHRDIKPSNLFLTHRGDVKVLDFGIARLLGEQSLRLTQKGFALGTPAFMPPEQARGDLEQIGPATDVWAVGATMLNLLSGELVHTGPVLEQLKKAVSAKARSLGAVGAFEPSLVAIVDRALSFEPSVRYADAASMLLALDDAFPWLAPLRATTKKGPLNRLLGSDPAAIATGPCLGDGTLVGMVDGGMLDEPRIRAHVAGCARCRATVEALRGAQAASPPPIPVPAPLPAGVAAATALPPSRPRSSAIVSAAVLFVSLMVALVVVAWRAGAQRAIASTAVPGPVPSAAASTVAVAAVDGSAPAQASPTPPAPSAVSSAAATPSRLVAPPSRRGGGGGGRRPPAGASSASGDWLDNRD